MGNLLTAIQWLGTLSFAFVAIGFVESFTTAICKVIFHTDRDIENEYKKCTDILPDSVSLNLLSPVTIDGKSTNDRIQMLQRKRENITEEIQKKKTEKIDELPKACQIKSLSSMSLFVVVICTVFMVIIGIKDIYGTFVNSFVVSMSVLTVIYLVLGWFYIDGKENKILNFPAFTHSLWCSCVVSILSVAVGFFINVTDDFCTITLAVCVFFGFLNFIVLAFIIGRKAKKYYKDIQEDAKGLTKKCQSIKNDFDTLLNVCQLREILKAE